MFVATELLNPNQLDVLLTMNVLLGRLVETDNVLTLALSTNLVAHRQYVQSEITSQLALVPQALKETHIVNVTKSRKENANMTMNVLTIMLVSKINVLIHVV